MLAHIGTDGRRHDLREHLLEVATLAAANAAGFNSKNWARPAGIWHEFGKYRSGFQIYIRKSLDVGALVVGCHWHGNHPRQRAPAAENRPDKRQVRLRGNG